MNTVDATFQLPIQAESLRYLMTMPREQRQRFCVSLMECSDASQKSVIELIAILENDQLSVDDRRQAARAIADALSLRVECEVQKTDSQEADFAKRLRSLLDKKGVTQHQLAERIGCTQPAISQMLNRKCRPMRKTLMKISEALNIDVRELWPDLEVADYLDAVAEFQDDGHVMTEAEADALRSTPQLPSSRIGRPLPSRKLDNLE